MSGSPLVDHLRAVRRVLRERELVARRRLGQHFLLEARTLRRIVAAAGDVQGRSVVEIGPGPGGLTSALLEAGARVLGIELDRDWARFAAKRLQGEVEILCEDAMAQEGVVLQSHLGRLAERDGRAPLLVSNLPYQIASPLLVDVLHSEVPPELLIVMVQKEVAARLTARPRDRERGLLTVLVQSVATTRRCFFVPAGAFTPPPRVDSTIVELRPDAARRRRHRDHPHLRDLLRRAFQGRRKMLRRSLREVLTAEARDQLGDDFLARRPEELDLEDWFRLAALMSPDTEIEGRGSS